MTTEENGFTYFAKEQFDEVTQEMLLDPKCEVDTKVDGKCHQHYHALYTTPERVLWFAEKFKLSLTNEDHPTCAFGSPSRWIFDEETHELIEWHDQCAHIGIDWTLEVKNVQM